MHVSRNNRNSGLNRGELLVALSVAAVLLGLLVWRMRADGPAESTPELISSTPQDGPLSSQSVDSLPRSTTMPGDAKSEVNLIDDDGQTLWAAPTAGKPIRLDYLPAGTQLVVNLRPAEMISTESGSRFWKELVEGPWTFDALRSIVGVPLEEVTELRVAIYSDEDGSSKLILAFLPSESTTRQTLVDAWDNAKPAQHRGRDYLEGERWSYLFPEAKSGLWVVAGETAALRELIELGGASPIRKEFEQLARTSDGSRHLTVMGVPRDLIALLKGQGRGARSAWADAVSWLLDDELPLAMCSIHVANQSYFELAALATAGEDPARLADRINGRMHRGQQSIANHLVDFRPGPYGSALVTRLPQMLAALVEHTRTGSDGRVAILRAYLPAAGAHNLLLAAGLFPISPQ